MNRLSRTPIRIALAATAIMAGAWSSAAAQGGGQPAVPRALRPPPGMCRVWLDNVPARLQPAPTDCATAMRNRPASARVIFGDSATGKSFSPAKDASHGKSKSKKKPDNE